jgi:hypothetical protein
MLAFAGIIGEAQANSLEVGLRTDRAAHKKLTHYQTNPFRIGLPGSKRILDR